MKVFFRKIIFILFVISISSSGVMLSSCGRKEVTPVRAPSENLSSEMSVDHSFERLNLPFTIRNGIYIGALAIIVKPQTSINIGPYQLKYHEISQDRDGALVKVYKDGQFLDLLKLSDGLEYYWLKNGALFVAETGLIEDRELLVFHKILIYPEEEYRKKSLTQVIKPNETLSKNSVSVTLLEVKTKNSDAIAVFQINVGKKRKIKTLKELDKIAITKDITLALGEIGVGKQLKWATVVSP